MRENWEIFILKQNETNRVRIAYMIVSYESEEKSRADEWKEKSV